MRWKITHPSIEYGRGGVGTSAKRRSDGLNLLIFKAGMCNCPLMIKEMKPVLINC